MNSYGERRSNETHESPTDPEAKLARKGTSKESKLSYSGRVLMCEALIDALTFWCAGFRNVTSAYGIEGFTPELLEAFQHHSVEEALIAFDRDEAGDRGAERVAAALIEVGVSCYRVEFPKGMDANEYALRMKPAAKAFEVALAGAKLMGLGKGRTASRPAPPPFVESQPTPTPSASSSTSPRQGARLAALRRAAGLTQTELADVVGETQRNIAYWEQADKPPRSDVIPRLASVLGVSVETLLTADGELAPAHQRGSVGRAQKAFQKVAQLPRRQQDKIIEIVEAFVAQQERRAS